MVAFHCYGFSRGFLTRPQSPRNVLSAWRRPASSIGTPPSQEAAALFPYPPQEAYPPILTLLQCYSSVRTRRTRYDRCGTRWLRKPIVVAVISISVKIAIVDCHRECVQARVPRPGFGVNLRKAQTAPERRGNRSPRDKLSIFSPRTANIVFSNMWRRYRRYTANTGLFQWAHRLNAVGASALPASVVLPEEIRRTEFQRRQNSKL